MFTSTRLKTSGVDVVPVKQPMPTQVLVPVETENGRHEVVLKVLEQELEPLSTLHYDDFTIEKLLAAGVQPRHLDISPDWRMGHDVDVEAFEARVAENVDKVFDVKDE